MEVFAFCVITFEPIKIQNCEAPQNDRLNLTFVKDGHIVGKKMAGNGHKTAICQSVLNRNSLYFLLEQSAPFVPELHEHWPVAESHIPSPLQLFGQDNG